MQLGIRAVTNGCKALPDPVWHRAAATPNTTAGCCLDIASSHACQLKLCSKVPLSALVCIGRMPSQGRFSHLVDCQFGCQVGCLCAQCTVLPCCDHLDSQESSLKTYPTTGAKKLFYWIMPCCHVCFFTPLLYKGLCMLALQLFLFAMLSPISGIDQG